MLCDDDALLSCHFVIPSRRLNIHPILLQSVQFAKRFLRKCTVNVMESFVEFGANYLSLWIWLTMTFSHIICLDIKNLYLSWKTKKPSRYLLLFSSVWLKHESAFTLRFYLRLFLGPARTALVWVQFFSLSEFSHCTPDSVCVRSVSLHFPFLNQGRDKFNQFAYLPNVYTCNSFLAAFLWVLLSAILPFNDTP